MFTVSIGDHTFFDKPANLTPVAAVSESIPTNNAAYYLQTITVQARTLARRGSRLFCSL